MTKKAENNFTERIGFSLDNNAVEIIARRAVEIIEEKKSKEATAVCIKMYTLDDIYEITKLSPQSLRRHVKKGLLKATRSGRSYLVTQENLNKYLKLNENEN